MKKIALSVLCAVMMMSCAGNKTQEKAEPTDSVVAVTDSVATPAAEEEEEKAPSAEEIITEQINANYNAALKADNEESSIKKYCSAAFISTYNKYQKAIEGEMGDIDYDLWLQAQDSSKPSAEVTGVTMKGEDNAEVKIGLKNFGTKTALTLKVVKEGDSWKIDDFVNAGTSVIKVMKDNIKSFSN